MIHDVDRHRRPGRRPECSDGPEHRLRPDDVLGRPRSVARRTVARAAPEPDRDGQAVYQADRRPAPDDPGLHRAVQEGFGTDVTLDGMAKAIAAFERAAALSGNSKYDKYVSGRYEGPVGEREARHGSVRAPARQMTTNSRPTSFCQKAECTSAMPGSTSPTSSSTTSASAGTARREVRRPGPVRDRRRSGPRTARALGRSRRRPSATSPAPLPTCTTAA